MRTINRFTVKISAAISTITLLAWASISGTAADIGVKGRPPYVWAPVATKADADAVKPGDSIAMVCAKCKTLSITLVTQDTKTKTKLIPGEKHLCTGCNSTIEIVGSKANNKEVIKHVCKACGDDSAFCCVTKPGSGATEGMGKEKK